VTRARDLTSLVLSSRHEPDFVQAVLGSCFFPVLYGRTIRLRGELVLDGGLTDNLPLEAVVARGARTILAVVPAHDGSALARPFRPRVFPEDLAPVARPLVPPHGSASHAHDRNELTAARSTAVRVITIRPARPLAIRSWDLDRARVSQAIAAGREAAALALRRM